MRTPDLVGWLGSALLVGAFAASTAGLLPQGPGFYLANLLGAAGVGWHAAVHRAWPALAVEAVWAVVAAFGLVRSLTG